MRFDKAETVLTQPRRANLFGDRVALYKEPAWHSLGTVFTEPLTVVEGTKLAKMDYKVRLVKPTVRAFGQTVPVDSFAVVRQPTDDDPEAVFFGMVGKGYRILDNLDIAKKLEPLAKLWPLESNGSINRGETVFWCLNAGMVEVAGELVNMYAFIVDGKAGGLSIHVGLTATRIVCQNTVAIGLANATVDFKLPHRAGISQDLTFHTRVLAEMREAREKAVTALQELAEIKVAAPDVQVAARTVFPDPKPGQKARLLDELKDAVNYLSPDLVDRLGKAGAAHETAMLRAIQARADVGLLYDRVCDEYPSIAGTGWALYNAFTEYADWREGRSTVQVATSALFGERAREKDRAYKAIVAIA